MSNLLRCEGLSKQYGARTLFQGVRFTIDENERLGVIGPNGAGKSTLLKIIAGLESPESGQQIARKGLALGYVPQTHDFDPEGVCLRIVAEALTDRLPQEDERLLQARIALDRVGFDDPERTVAQLSGGWIKRLAIARELAREPDVLLLDEPTNHLDLEGVLWLEDLLKRASFSSVVVTHDRYFLETVATRILELNRCFPEGTFTTTGSYSQFLERREAFLEAQQAEQAAIENKLRGERDWLSRGPKARGTKAKGRIDRAHAMMAQAAELKVRNTAHKAADVSFEATGRKTHRLIRAKGLTKSLGGKKLFEDLELELPPKHCLGLLGANGSGKSTLIRTLIGEIEPDAGTVEHADALKVAHFSQHREVLQPTQNLREALANDGDQVEYRGRRMHVTAWAKRFLFTSEQFKMPVGSLSGGEQARIMIARLMLKPADVLVLDEPTNDLDIATLEVLEQSIDEFPGAVLLVTHDRYMLQRVADGLLWLDGNGGAHHLADYEQYERRKQAAEAKRQDEPAAKPAKLEKTPANGKNSSPNQKRKKLSYKEQLEFDGMEDTILAAEAELEQLQAQLANPKAQADHQEANRLYQAMGAAQEKVSKLYERWEELEAKQQPGG